MKIKFIILLIAASALLAISAHAGSFKYFGGQSFSEFAGIEFPQTECNAAFVLNTDTSYVIYAKNHNSIIYPASTVKLMTALVAFENIEDLDNEVTVSEAAVKATYGSHLGMKAGEIYTYRQLLYALLLQGANDAANTLAIDISGSIEAFCRLMNEKARILGASNTHYSNPTGLHNEKTFTTAYDTALVAYEFCKNDILTDISNTQKYTFECTSTDREETQTVTLSNRNNLIFDRTAKGYFYKGAKGLNSGATTEAGNCLVSLVKAKGTSYLTVIMGSPEKNSVICSYTDAHKILDTCFNSFEFASISHSKSAICEIPVYNSASTDYTLLYCKESTEVLLPANYDENEITINYTLYDKPALAPIEKGQEFGWIDFSYKGEAIFSTALVTATDAERSNILYILYLIKNFVKSKVFIIIALICLSLFALYLFIAYRIGRRRKRYRNMR